MPVVPACVGWRLKKIEEEQNMHNTNIGRWEKERSLWIVVKIFELCVKLNSKLCKLRWFNYLRPNI